MEDTASQGTEGDHTVPTKKARISTEDVVPTYVRSSMLVSGATGLLFTLSSCGPIPGPGQVATNVIPPPGKSPIAQQYENAACTSTANGVLQVYVRCMEQRGYQVLLVGPGGVPMSASQLSASSRQGLATRDSSVSVDQYKSNELDFAAAKAADRAGNYQEALRLYEKVDLAGGPPATDSSDFVAYNNGITPAFARSEIGRHYEQGIGVERNYHTAAIWYEKAMACECVNPATMRLGFLYANGLGVPKDREKARELFKTVHALNTIIEAMDNNLLPMTLDDWTPAVAQAIKIKLDEQEQARTAEMSSCTRRRNGESNSCSPIR